LFLCAEVGVFDLAATLEQDKTLRATDQHRRSEPTRSGNKQSQTALSMKYRAVRQDSIFGPQTIRA
jgi:hypothetical protein